MASQAHSSPVPVPDDLMDPSLPQSIESAASRPVISQFHPSSFAAVNTIEEEDDSELYPFRSDILARSPPNPRSRLFVPESRHQGGDENRSPFNNRPRRIGYQAVPPASPAVAPRVEIQTPPNRTPVAPPGSVPAQQGYTPAPEVGPLALGQLRTPVADRVKHHHVLLFEYCGRCIRHVGTRRERPCTGIRITIASDTLTTR